MKNKSLRYAMLHGSIVTHAQARRIAAAQRGRCFRTMRGAAGMRGVPEQRKKSGDTFSLSLIYGTIREKTERARCREVRL